MDIKKLFEENYIGKEIEIKGWIRNHRRQATFGFIDLTDGTGFKTVQVVYTNELNSFDKIAKVLVGSSIKVKGIVTESEGKQDFEIKASEITVIGLADETYPIQPKRHTREFLRKKAYLRPRTNLFNAVFRVRSAASFAIHAYFQERGYLNVHSPILTTNDGEGAGEMFNVTTLDFDKIAKERKYDYKDDFFGKKVGLTVTGQLEGEAFAHAFKKIYTFGPTFRAENSHTKTHAAEFWMIEPEVAFCDLDGIMDVMEDMLKYVVKYVLDKCKDEMEFLDSFVEKGLLDKLNNVLDNDFHRIDYEDIIKLLQDSKKDFDFKPVFGGDISREHERYITEYYKVPVFIKNWPKDIKAFYMKLNEDNKTVAAVDLQVPAAGELMGGSQREEDLDKLRNRMKDMNVKEEGMEWYLNLRKYGTVPHSGFGLGFERLIIYLTGVDNIRDVIPFPRTPGNI
ncbi:MAG TPA: asparagine--tRNA ligase [Mollicutes bacterium]|nr:asparagine--tRNA ligase [Mollicutes bacterium]